MGPSGSGKTTLLNLIAGIDKPDAGELARRRRATSPQLGEAELADWRAAHVGFIFQFYNLMPVLTAFENVELPLLLTALSRARAARARRTALAHGRPRPTAWSTTRPSSPAASSSASRSRARSSPIRTLIVADEPTGDLDRQSRGGHPATCCDRLNSELGKTIVMVTHDPQRGGARAARDPPRQGRADATRRRSALMRLTMYFLKLIVRNAFRHKLRTGSRSLGLVVAVLAFGLLQTVVDAWYAGADAASATRLVTRNAISLVFPLPLYYRDAHPRGRRA